MSVYFLSESVAVERKSEQKLVDGNDQNFMKASMVDFQISLGVNIFLSVLLLMVLGELFTFHLVLIYKNITTYDFIMASRAMFKAGKLKRVSLADVCCCCFRRWRNKVAPAGNGLGPLGGDQQQQEAHNGNGNGSGNDGQPKKKSESFKINLCTLLFLLRPAPLSLSLSMSDVRRPGRTREKRPNDGKTQRMKLTNHG